MIPLRTLWLVLPMVLTPAASMAPASATIVDDPLCPTLCSADADQSDTGSVPSGVYFLLDVSGVLDGEGNQYCETCNGNNCQATVTFSFDDPSGNNCLTYGWGSGLTTTGATISETRTLGSDCDDFEPATFSASIGSCTPGGSSSYSASVKLYCPCD